MPSPWNDASDRQLLLVMLHLTQAPRPNWEQVATLMGDGFTAESVRQHFQKMRKECETTFGALDTSSTTPSTPAKGTPRKKGIAQTPSKSTSKRKTKADGETIGEAESPTKKQFVKGEGGAEDSA